MTDQQSPADAPAFVDTPLLQAKRAAFDQPTQDNLDKLIAEARAADAQQIEWFQKRTAWYEQQIAALRAENAAFAEDDLVMREQIATLQVERKEAEAQLAALQAEQQDMQVQLDHAKWRAEQSNGLRDEATNQLEALQAEQAQWQQRVTRFCDAMADWQANERGGYDGLIAIACSGWTELAALTAQQEKP